VKPGGMSHGFDRRHRSQYPLDMKTSRIYRQTVVSRARRDARFRKGLLKNAVMALQTNELQTSKDMLRNYIAATEGFSALGVKCGKSSRSLTWMLSPQSNPTVTSFFSVLTVLLKDAGLKLILMRSRLR
jgi:DNA-binding phage protein